MSQTARRLGPQDMFFLYSESSTTMMHVGALMPFTPPSGAPPDLLRQLVDESKASEVVEPWSLRLSHPELLYHPTQSWVVDDNFDLDYHVRRSALASPGDERELGIPVSRWPYTFNLCVSNVPGPEDVLYLRGSRMEASYPVSLVAHSQALNVTLQSYAGTLNFGFIGCRDTLPHLQRLAVYTGEALDQLAAADGAAGLGS